MEKRIGFLLSYIKYGESDAILHVFTKEEGYKSIFVRGVYAPKSKKRALLRPLIELEFNLNSHKRGLQTASTLQILKAVDGGNIKINSLLFFIADFLNNILRDEINGTPVFDEIESFVSQLHRNSNDAHIQFLIHFTQLLGVNPLLSDEPYLNPIKGLFESKPSHHLFDAETSEIWKLGLLDPYHTVLNNNKRKSLLEGLMVYYSEHVPGFKIPASLSVLQQLWK